MAMHADVYGELERRIGRRHLARREITAAEQADPSAKVRVAVASVAARLAPRSALVALRRGQLHPGGARADPGPVPARR